MNKIPHNIAIAIIERRWRDSESQLFSHPESRASISHWLHDRDSIPILGTRRDKSTWHQALVDFVTSNNQNGNEREADAELEMSFEGVPFMPSADPSFKFIDLFAGIGGFRIALQELGGKCVFSSEWDKAAQNTYFANYGEIPFGDIRQFTDEKLTDAEIDALIPDHSVLAAGFPCQPFSRAGVSARQFLGHATGFACETQGTCFWDIVRIAKVKQPDLLILENVKNLKSHDGGRTFDLIRQTIESELEYSFHEAVVDAKTLVPQHRERCYIVCFKDRTINFEFPRFQGEALPLRSILDPDPTNTEAYTISKRLWIGHQNRTKRNVARGTGFTAYTADLEKPAHTLVARYGKDGKECLIPQADDNPRMLTPRECADLQGFPREFILPQYRTSAYRQFGNSIAVPVVKRIAEAALQRLALTNPSIETTARAGA